MSINKVILLGRVGKDPEVRQFDNGSKASFSLACSERGYTTKSGTQIPERTEWFNVVVFGSLAEICEKYVKKGNQLYVEGKLRTRSYEKDGITRYVTEVNAEKIELLGGGQPSQSDERDTRSNQRGSYDDDRGINAGMDDDLPF